MALISAVLMDGLEETSTGGRGSSGVSISWSRTKILILRWLLFIWLIIVNGEPFPVNCET
jgi:hypothetical protein